MIWVDLDGVLADFEKAYREQFHAEAKQEDRNKLWRNLNSAPNFFRDLEEMPRARELWELCMPYDAHVLTALSKYGAADCQEQKLTWLRNFGVEPGRIAMVVEKKNKPLYCTANDILIDDQKENIVNWQRAGGRGILYTNFDFVKEWILKMAGE